MKKCASCSKDLPEAALHCVFCGAKQAPAPAVPASAVAKTAFGYSANEVLQQLGNQPPAARPQSPATAPTRQQPASQPPPYQSGGLAPTAAANAATLYVAPASPPAYGGSPKYPPSAPTYTPASTPPAPAAPPSASGGMGIQSRQQPTPAPLPTVPQPYLGAYTGVAPAGRPIEPWKDSLRLMMFVWGAVLLAAFATPTSIDPLTFSWDAILAGEGRARIPGLVIAGAGLLAIVFAAIPLATLPRGALAAVLGLAGLFVPMALDATPEWQRLLPLVGSFALVSGLLVRHAYVESLLARILVTIGVVTWLAPYLIPQGGQIPLVGIIKILLDGANHMEVVVIALAQILLAVLCLLVWMPGPATAGAKIFAWLVLLFPVVTFALALLPDADLASLATSQPAKLLLWAPEVAYGVFVGYGMASVLGKQLE